MSQEDMDADDLLLAASRSGAPAAKWPSVGNIVEGYITQRPRKTEQRGVDGKIKTFDDGTVRMQVLIEVQTEQRDPELPDDDGLRTLWCKWEIQKAISAAIIAAGVKRLENGGFLQVGRSQDIPPQKKGHKPTQTFVAKYTPPAVQAADDMFAAGPAAVTFSQPPTTTTSTVVFENQHQPSPQRSEDTRVPEATKPRVTTLDALKNMSFNAQGSPQSSEAPF